MASMMPMLNKTREYISGRSALAERAAGAQAMAQHATGRFSWRGERGPDSTVVASGGAMSAADADRTLPSAAPLSGHRAAVLGSSADGAATPAGAAGAGPGQLPLPSESPARPEEWGGTVPSRGRGSGLPAAAAGYGPNRSTASVSTSWQATVDARESSMAASGDYAGEIPTSCCCLLPGCCICAMCTTSLAALSASA
jgi:hypothetical protein